GGPGFNGTRGGGGEDGDFTRGNNLGQTLLVLGQGTNTVQTPQLIVSGFKSPASVFLGNGPVAMTTNGDSANPVTSTTYAPPVPILLKGGAFPTATISDAGGGKTALFIGYQNDPTATAAASGTNSIGVLDTTGGILNGTFGVVTLGLNSVTPTSTHGGGVGSWVLGV